MKNADNLCLTRSLVGAIAIVNDDPKVKSIKDGRIKTQNDLAEKLMTGSGLGGWKEAY